MNPSRSIPGRCWPARASRCARTAFRVDVEFVRGNEVLWLGMSRPQWFLLVILPLLFWRTLRVFGNPLRPKVERRVA